MQDLTTRLMRAGCVVLGLATLLPAAAVGAAARPNFIVVLIDDLGWGDLSCFGNQEARTVHIDRLAAEGIRFGQFYVNAPICSPSRVALSTGQYPHRWRITSYLDHRAENERRGLAQWLDPAAPMLARFLQQAGYATGHFGKWHMGGQRDVGEAPLIAAYGFDESLTNFEGLGPRLLGLGDPHDGSPPRRISLRSETLGHGPVIWYDRAELTAGYAGAAIQFMERAAADGKPCYVNLWPDDVHAPFFPPEGRRGDGSTRDLLHGVLEHMDAQLGVLFDHVRQSPALRGRTLIVLCSDNGAGEGSSGPLFGRKASLYEGGVRSPLIVWGPGIVAPEKAGRLNEKSVLAAFDLPPSLLELAGVAVPSEVVLDGEPLGDTLVGRAEGSRVGPLCWRRPPDRKGVRGRGPFQPDLAMREGDWKLLCEYDGSQPELYDLARDPGETANLAARHADVTARMTAALLAWHAALPPDHGPALGRQVLEAHRERE